LEFTWANEKYRQLTSSLTADDRATFWSSTDARYTNGQK
jgi:hypothetical protein